jgi:hypothetical protein
VTEEAHRRIFLFDGGRGRDRSGDSGPWKKQPNCWIQLSALQPHGRSICRSDCSATGGSCVEEIFTCAVEDLDGY